MDKNFVLLVEYECGESAYLTNTPDLTEALAEYTSQVRERWGNSTSKSCGLPLIKQAKIIRLWK